MLSMLPSPSLLDRQVACNGGKGIAIRPSSSMGGRGSATQPTPSLCAQCALSNADTPFPSAQMKPLVTVHAQPDKWSSAVGRSSEGSRVSCVQVGPTTVKHIAPIPGDGPAEIELDTAAGRSGGRTDWRQWATIVRRVQSASAARTRSSGQRRGKSSGASAAGTAARGEKRPQALG